MNEQIISGDYHAIEGHPLPKGRSIATHDMIVDAIKLVQDPELMLDVYNLGLIYDIKIKENGDVNIDMSLTSPACPIAGEMPGMVARAVTTVEGTGIVDVKLIWDPPWTIDRLSDEIKMIMGI